MALNQVYLSPQEQNPVRQNSVTRQLLEKLSALNFITPEDYGAKGDGKTDDTTAIQNAVTAGLATAAAGTPTVVFLANYYLITSAVLVTIPASGNTTNFSIVGKAKNGCGLTTTAASISMLKIDSTANGAFYFTFANFTLQGNGTQNGIEFVGDGSGSGSLEYCSFDHLFFNNMTNGFLRLTNTVNSDWNQFTNITMLTVVNGFNFRNWGTGTLWANGNLVLSGGGAGFQLGVGGGATIGDMSIIGWQMGGSGTGFIIDGGVYGNNISVNSVQFDAGISPGWNFKNVADFEARNVNYGGAVAAATLQSSTCRDLDLDERRSNIVVSTSTSTAAQNDYSVPTGVGVLQLSWGADTQITGINNGYDGRNFMIQNIGGVHSIFLTDLSGLSNASNQFNLNGNVTLLPSQSILLRYVGNFGSGNPNKWTRNGGQ